MNGKPNRGHYRVPVGSPECPNAMPAPGTHCSCWWEKGPVGCCWCGGKREPVRMDDVTLDEIAKLAAELIDAEDDVIEAARNWADVWREIGNGLPASQSVLNLFDAVNRLEGLEQRHKTEVRDRLRDGGGDAGTGSDVPPTG